MIFTAATKFSAIDGMTPALKRMGAAAHTMAGKFETGLARTNRMFGGMAGTFAAGAIGVSAFNAVRNYEEALMSLSAVTGIGGKGLEAFDSQIKNIANSSKVSAIDVAKSFAVVGSAMSQYLDNPKALGEITDAGILLSKASGMELTPAIESLTSSMNQFSLGSENARKVVEMLTAGEMVGSVFTGKASEQLSKFGAVASTVGVDLAESMTLIQTLGIKFTGSLQSEIGTAARNLLLIMDTSSAASQDAAESLARNGVSMKVLGNNSLPLADRLKELSKIQNDSVAMSKVFGRENYAAGAVIFDQLETYKNWLGTIRETEKAQFQAAQNTSTFNNALKKIKSAFDNYLISADSANMTLNILGGIIRFVADNFTFLANSLIIITGLYWGYSFVLGIHAFAVEKDTVALTGNRIALFANKLALVSTVIWIKACTFATTLWTLAVKALSFTIMGTPIGWIILAIAALVAIIIICVKYWDQIKAAMISTWDWIKSNAMNIVTMFMPIIGIFKKVWDYWEFIKASFSEGGFLQGIKTLGQTILSALISPLIMILELLNKVGMFKGVTADLKNFQAELDAKIKANGSTLPANNQAQTTQTIVSNNNRNDSMQIDINDNSNGKAMISKQPQFIPVSVKKTGGI